jgi:hypothetical protein
VTVVPRAAVFERDGAAFVNVVREGVAQAVPVKAGREIGDTLEVSGVEPGMRVVVKPAGARALEGKRVRVESR